MYTTPQTPEQKITPTKNMNKSLPELERPEFSEQEAGILLEENYGLCCTLEELPGERDRNYLAQEHNGESYVLKISNSCETLEFLKVQNNALESAAMLLEKGRIPSVYPNKNGEPLSRVRSTNGSLHWLRLVPYVDGLSMAEYRPHTREFLLELGAMCGTVTKALHKIPLRTLDRRLLWEMHNVQDTLNEYLTWIKDKKLRNRVSRSLDLYKRTMEPLESKLRRGWIHNDFNDYNVLVLPKLAGTPDLGLIDFGDMTHSYLVAEPAVACAYAMLDKPDPLEAAVHLIRGFHQRFPLEENELEILFPMILMRLCLSLTIGAFQQQNDPKNEYLGISQQHACELLERLHEVNPRFAYYLFRDACNMEAFPSLPEFSKWQKKVAGSFHFLLGEPLNTEKTTVLDLSAGSSFSAKSEGMSLETQQEILNTYLREKNAEIGVGIPIWDPKRIEQLGSEHARARVVAAEYRALALRAFEEVETAAVQFNRRREQLKLADEIVRKAGKVREFTADKLRAGLVSQLEVLEDERRILTARRQSLTLHTELLTDTVAIFRALGGP